jgi:hypothetical protein
MGTLDTKPHRVFTTSHLLLLHETLYSLKNPKTNSFLIERNTKEILIGHFQENHKYTFIFYIFHVHFANIHAYGGMKQGM